MARLHTFFAGFTLNIFCERFFPGVFRESIGRQRELRTFLAVVAKRSTAARPRLNQPELYGH